MWRWVLLVLLTLTGCARGEGGSGSCAAVIVYEGAVYLGTGEVKGVPAPGRRVGDGAVPGCDDGGGPEPEEPVKVREVPGVPHAVALYARGDLYVDPGYPTDLREHPLHEQLGDDRVRRFRGRPCRLAGDVDATEPLWVSRGGHHVNVVIDRRTQVVGFDRAGLPYLRVGDRVTVAGRACRGETVLARRIEAGP